MGSGQSVLSLICVISAQKKLFNPLYLKMESRNIEPYSILLSLFDYPRDSIDLLTSETTVIELKNPSAMDQITKMLAEA